MVRSYSRPNKPPAVEVGGIMRRSSKTASRTALLLTVSALASTAAAAEPACTGKPSDTKLFVRVEGVRSSAGLMAITLYANNSKKFLARHGSL
jgi:uncharacterized protein (DUF2141 family)